MTDKDKEAFEDKIKELEEKLAIAIDENKKLREALKEVEKV